MTYTSHGLMTPTDRADHDALYDTGRNPECPGHDNEDNTALVYCSRAENCPDADELPDDLSYEEMYGERP